MRTFLLILGIVFILIGLIAAVQTLARMGQGDHRRSGTMYPADIGDAAFCAVLYGAGFASLYLRHRITKPKDGK